MLALSRSAKPDKKGPTVLGSGLSAFCLIPIGEPPPYVAPSPSPYPGESKTLRLLDLQVVERRSHSVNQHHRITKIVMYS